jgi:hypothetical protein
MKTAFIFFRFKTDFVYFYISSLLTLFSLTNEKDLSVATGSLTNHCNWSIVKEMKKNKTVTLPIFT